VGRCRSYLQNLGDVSEHGLAALLDVFCRERLSLYRENIQEQNWLVIIKVLCMKLTTVARKHHDLNFERQGGRLHSASVAWRNSGAHCRIYSIGQQFDHGTTLWNSIYNYSSRWSATQLRRFHPPNLLEPEGHTYESASKTLARRRRRSMAGSYNGLLSTWKMCQSKRRLFL